MGYGYFDDRDDGVRRGPPPFQRSRPTIRVQSRPPRPYRLEISPCWRACSPRTHGSQRVEALFTDGSSPDHEVITQSFWSACHGGQLRTAEYFLDRGADIKWIGWDDKTPLDLVNETTQPELAAWLRARGAKHAKELRTP